MKRFITITLISVLALSMTDMALATGEGEGKNDAYPRVSRGMDADRLAEKLDLSPEEARALAENFSDHHAETAQSREKARDAQKELAAYMEAGDFKQENARSYHARIRRIHNHLAAPATPW